MTSVTIVGTDQVGMIAESDGIRYYLTPCCQASVTGVSVTASNPEGIACRACYQPVDPALSWAELAPSASLTLTSVANPKRTRL
jgi:hypothetical protein